MDKSQKRRIVMTAIIVSCAAILILLGILALITDSFIINTILHIYLDLLLFPIIIKLLQKCFKNLLTHNLNKATIWCSIFLFLDLVVIEAIRYIISDGISTILFFPPCIPICFMIMSYFAKDSEKVNRKKTVVAFSIGIPLLLLSLYFEVLSFIQI